MSNNLKRVLIIVFLIGFVPLGHAFEKELKGVVVVAGPDIVLRTSTPRFVNAELVSVLRSGVSLTVNYEVYIHENGFLSALFLKKKVFFQKTLAFDIQENIYVMRTPGQVVKNNDLKTVLESFYSEDDIVLGKTTEFKPQLSDYYIRYRLHTETIKLYPPLSLIFSFIDIYNFTTSWFTLDMEKKNEKS